jgi:hypothetical protein
MLKTGGNIPVGGTREYRREPLGLPPPRTTNPAASALRGSIPVGGRDLEAP